MTSEADSKKKGFEEGYWSKDMIKDVFLDEQRQYMWNMDYWRSTLIPLLGLEHDSLVLDVGCGLGFIGQSLAEFIPEGKVIGIDLDPKLVETAKKLVEGKKLESLFDFRVGNALHYP